MLIQLVPLMDKPMIIELLYYAESGISMANKKSIANSQRLSSWDILYNSQSVDRMTIKMA